MTDTTFSLAAVSPAAAPASTLDSAAQRLAVTVFDDFSAARPVWAALTAGGVATPYQSFSFCEASFRHVEGPAGARAALVLISSAAGEPLMLLPLAARGGVARFIGGKQVNYALPVMADAAQKLNPAALAAALAEAGAQAGINLFAFSNQPEEWRGRANPLAALNARPSPSNAYRMQLMADGEALMKARLSKDSRRKLRQKENKLAGMGAAALRRPHTPEEANAVLDAFFAFKAERFAAQGVSDPFAGAAIRALLRELAATGLEVGAPVLELHALTLDGAPIAIFGGMAGADRWSGLFTAFSPDAEISRCSPGDLLLWGIAKSLCARGLSSLDLGVGEAHYKDKACDVMEPLVDSFHPVTLQGRLQALAMAGKQTAKRIVKNSSVGKALVARLRMMRAR